jgi:hypothetical protein
MTGSSSTDQDPLSNSGVVHQAEMLQASLTYTGSFQNGLYHGEGRLVTTYRQALKNNLEASSPSTKHQYVGDFFNGVYHGHGREYMLDGSIYKGEVTKEHLFALTRSR